MVTVIEIIENIIELASMRRKLIVFRSGKKDFYEVHELVAKSDLEVELFDCMDSLTLSEFEQLYEVASRGGFKSTNSLSTLDEKIDAFYLCVDLDKFLTRGLQKV